MHITILGLVFAVMVFSAEAADPAGQPTQPRRAGVAPVPVPERAVPLLGAKPPILPDRSGQPAPGADPLVIPDEWLVGSDSMEQAAQEQKQLETLGLRIKRRSSLPALGLVLTVYRPPMDKDSFQLMEELQHRHPRLRVEFNQRYLPQGSVSSTDQEGSVREFGHVLTGIGRAGCPAFRDTIALMDAAADSNSPVLSKGGFEQVHVFSAPPNASDHGTAVANLLATLLPNARVLAVSVYREEDAVLETRSDWLLAGFEKVLAHDPLPKALNMSFGGNASPLLERAIARLHQRGIRMVAAAGNGGPKAGPVYPAAYPEVRAVAAVDLKEGTWSESNRGEYIDYAAPGVDLWLPRVTGEYAFVSGTSYAAPWVTAAAALATDEQWKKPASLARDLGKPGRDSDYGYGLVQLGSLCR